MRIFAITPYPVTLAAVGYRPVTGSNRHSVRIDETGLRRLEPLPDTATLDEFYRDTYYAANEGKAPDIKRLRDDAEAAPVSYTHLTLPTILLV